MKRHGPPDAASVDGKLRAGGGELVKIDATAGQAALDVAVDVEAAALPRVRIGRIR